MGQISLESVGQHGPLHLIRVDADGAQPPHFQKVPIALRASDVFETGGQRQFGIGTDGTVEGTPSVQWKGEYAERANLGFLAFDDQRQDARQTIFGRHQ